MRGKSAGATALSALCAGRLADRLVLKNLRVAGSDELRGIVAGNRPPRDPPAIASKGL